MFFAAVRPRRPSLVCTVNPHRPTAISWRPTTASRSRSPAFRRVVARRSARSATVRRCVCRGSGLRARTPVTPRCLRAARWVTCSRTPSRRLCSRLSAHRRKRQSRRPRCPSWSTCCRSGGDRTTLAGACRCSLTLARTPKRQRAGGTPSGASCPCPPLRLSHGTKSRSAR